MAKSPQLTDFDKDAARGQMRNWDDRSDIAKNRSVMFFMLMQYRRIHACKSTVASGCINIAEVVEMLGCGVQIPHCHNGLGVATGACTNRCSCLCFVIGQNSVRAV